MDKTARITITIPGNNRHIAPDVLLADLAKKLRGVDLSSGVHEVLIFTDGSVTLDLAMVWEPTKAPVVEQNERLANHALQICERT